MTNWEFITKHTIKEVLCDTIEGLINAVTTEEFSEAEDKAISILWLLRDRKEVDLSDLQFSEAPTGDISGHNAVMPESRPSKG